MRTHYDSYGKPANIKFEDKFLTIKNPKNNNYELIDLRDISHLKVQGKKRGKSFDDDFSNLTILLFVIGFFTLIIYGIGLLFFILGIYKHKRLDLTSHAKLIVKSKQNNKISVIELGFLEKEELEYLFNKITHYLQNMPEIQREM